MDLMNLIIQGADVETPDLKQLAKLAGMTHLFKSE